MNNSYFKSLQRSLLVLALISTFTACKKDEETIFTSKEVSFQSGKTWSVFEKDKNDVPKRLSLVIDNVAMAHLDREGGEAHDHANSVVVELPQEASLTPFKHIWINWNPMGHPPMTIYDVPHFDFHFYTVSSSEREGFLDTAKLNKSLDPAYLPGNHLGVDPVPQMGKHYVDLTSPEFSGTPFTQTFIYGSNNGELVFMEPMITEAFLKSTTSYSRSIPQPGKFKVKGYYPSKMTVEKLGDGIHIVFEDFVLRQGE
jgi:hypothetical protein